MSWFAAEITGDNLLSVMRAWLHCPGVFKGFNTLLEGFESTCVAMPQQIV